MEKILYLDQMKDISIEDIIGLYQKGYRLDNNIYLQESTNSICFVVYTSDGPTAQALIYVDGIYRGITDTDGHLTVSDLTTSDIGISHTYLVIRQGYNARNGRILLFSYINSLCPCQTENVFLTRATVGKGSIMFQVNAYGKPAEGARIIIRDQEVGITGPDGTLLVEGLDRGKNVPYKVIKEGFDEIIENLIRIDNRITFTTEIITLDQTGPNIPIIFETIDISGNPIENVEINIDNDIVGMTDNNGSFHTNLDPTILHTYTVSKQGFRTIAGNIKNTDFNIIPIIMSKI